MLGQFWAAVFSRMARSKTVTYLRSLADYQFVCESVLIKSNQGPV